MRDLSFMIMVAALIIISGQGSRSSILDSLEKMPLVRPVDFPRDEVEESMA